MDKSLVLLVLLCAAPVSAQTVIRRNPPAEELTPGAVPGIKVSINDHGDPWQPWPGDAVAVASFIDDTRKRTRMWSLVSSFSVYGSTAEVAVGHEIDANNLSGIEPSEPGGPRSLYGLWISGAANTNYLGSAAMIVSSADGTKWRTGLFIDRADVGVQLGGTFENGLGVVMGRSRIRFQAFTAVPPNPPPGTCDLYAQYSPAYKVQLVLHCSSGALVLGEER